ncbi:chaperonin 10-like protein [Aspergillus avenaceus]|uniref:Chaperonin 10-like protein n=1 Tax=Aspergillus avenaceus TaxID=36643 RepID=A0A5N6TT01_ASPAV|nr:chaperonin 10-like protein [Aspergillus avenaceus]
MKAFEFQDIYTPLQERDLPRPQPREGQVLIEVKAAGLCHSDCLILRDETYSMIAQHPIILGHEVAGTIIELGPRVSGFQIGENIVSALISHPISNADLATAIGLGYNGGYAEFAIVYTENIVRIPLGVTFAQAAVAADSISTAYHALITEARVNDTSTVCIIGLGGLGVAGIQVVNALTRAKVYGIDINTRKFDAAHRLGAVQCATNLEELGHIWFDAIVDFAGAEGIAAAAASAVKAGGRVVLVGIGATEITLDPRSLVFKNVAVQGSIGASKSELEQVLQCIADGRLIPVLEEVPFADIPRGLERLEKGGVTGRLYVDPSKTA